MTLADEVATRSAAGFAVALVLALVAQRVGALSASGVAAAIAVGTASATAGWDWAALLILFFVTGSALSRLGGRRKAARLDRIVEKGGARDATQVLANGGVFAIAASVFVFSPSHHVLAFGAGALAAAAADTFATEIGALATGMPRSLLGGARVPAGTSGGVTWLGSAASVGGSLLVAGAVFLLGWPPRIALGALAGGVVGSFADSLLGALWQARRWCPRCDAPTERRVHDCGALTRRAGGIAWLDNDAVNVVCTAAGGLCAALIAR